MGPSRKPCCIILFKESGPCKHEHEDAGEKNLRQLDTNLKRQMNVRISMSIVHTCTACGKTAQEAPLCAHSDRQVIELCVLDLRLGLLCILPPTVFKDGGA